MLGFPVFCLKGTVTRIIFPSCLARAVSRNGAHSAHHSSRTDRESRHQIVGCNKSHDNDDSDVW